MKKQAPHLFLGKAGETYACNYLLQKGYTLKDKNWRYKHLELDLIFQDREQIVFVEVKTRASDLFGGPLGAISPVKMKKLIQAAQRWLIITDSWDTSCRFDVIGLTVNNEGFFLEHIINAFEAR